MIPHVVVDVGNTRIKWGLCTGGTITAIASLAPDQPAAWEQQLRRWGLAPPQLLATAWRRGPVPWMLTGVHPERRDRLAAWLRKRGDSVYLLNDPRQLPLRVLLDHPERAGIDRLLDAVAVNTRRRGDVPAIIVDAGSAVTVDLLDEVGAFRGGAIMPGLRLMAESLHRYTAKLPLIELPRTTPALPGLSTTAAMESGIYWAFVGGVRSLVEQYSAGGTVSPKVFLTGGDAAILHQHLPDSTFWPEMTLEGIRITAEGTAVSDTVAACLTPPGAAAIATIAVRGASAWEIVRRRFRPHSRSGAALPESPTTGAVWYGRFGADLADEVVLGVKSTTPIPWVEIHCHGGPQVVYLLLEALAAEGSRIVDWRTFVSDATDPLQALAALQLAEARTTRTAAILLDQYHGAFRDALTSAIGALERGEPPTVLESLARHARLGRHLVAPWRVTLAGAPNVGKSSLANALAGYQRSVVSPIPGTTRDVVTTTLAIDGWPVEIADTAGLRDAAGSLESLGIERARSAAASADLCLWVLDASAEPVWPDVADANVRLVVNKVDLPPTWDLDQATSAPRVSANTGAGVRELIERIGRWLVPETPEAGTAIPFTPLLADRVEEALPVYKRGEASATSDLLRGIRNGMDG